MFELWSASAGTNTDYSQHLPVPSEAARGKESERDEKRWNESVKKKKIQERVKAAPLSRNRAAL